MTQSFIVLGRQGQLGRDLVRALERSATAELLAAYGHEVLDVTDADAVRSALIERSPDWVLNAAAHTAVDRCEEEIDASMAVNGVAPGLLAEACNEVGASLVHISTDYVFDGESESPYREEHPTAPRSAYGRSKLEGEHRVRATGVPAWIVRTSWVFGPGKNFVGAILRQAYLRRAGKASGPLAVVDDQRGRPSYTADLAAGLLALCEHDPGSPQLLHLANAESCTWWDFARAILDLSGFEALEIDRLKTKDLELPAPRPKFSVLDCSRAESMGIRMRPWREALEAYLVSADGQEAHAVARAAVEAA